MRFPLSLNLSLMHYLTRQKLAGHEQYPIVTMLEPLHTCNYSCEGCGRIVEYRNSITEMMSVEECLTAASECGAPIVSVCGGEPLIYPKIKELIEGLQAQKRHVYLCTNAHLLEKSLPKFKPVSRLIFSVHLDGLEKTHDTIVKFPGSFQRVISGIKAAKASGYWVCTNTTIYKETELEEIVQLFRMLHSLKVDGMLIAPAYSYEAVADRDIFLVKEEVRKRFRRLQSVTRRLPLWNTPIYLDFLTGKRDFRCAAWGNPTRNPKGWRSPCYLIADTHYKTYKELEEKTDWNYYGTDQEPRCRNCMMHCGFEPAATIETTRSFKDSIRTLAWNFF